MIRQPNSEETIQAIELLYMSGPNIFSYFFIEQPPKIYDVLKIFFTKNDVIFSNVNTLVKTEGNNICGLLLSVSGKEAHILEKNMGKYGKELVNEIGIINMMKMLMRLKIQVYMNNLHNENEYYVSNLAVSEKYRGKGIGLELLNKAKEIAEEKKFNRLSLIVELDNQHAISVYEKFGFKIINTINLPTTYNKFNINGFHKMIKEL